MNEPLESTLNPTAPGRARDGIWYYNRTTGELEREVVFGEGAVAFLYDHPIGRMVGSLVTRRWFSVLYGLWNDSRFSRAKIRKFVETLAIPLDEPTRPVESYHSFNDFFARCLRPECRPLDPEPGSFVSSADARTLVFPLTPDVFTIKGVRIDVARLLGDPELAARYAGGSAIVYRLCPSDYHRFHFPAAGTPGPSRRILGRYDSVNPYALEKGIPVFLRNVREVSVLDSQAFGPVAILEVGAIGVGGIVQTYEPGRPVERGAEKGFFKFGGSTVVQLVEPGRVEFDADLAGASARGYETLVRFGMRLGRRT